MGSVVRVYPGPPFALANVVLMGGERSHRTCCADYGVDGRALLLIPIGYCLFPDEIGAVAQLGEHLLCKQGVSGSIPLSSTIFGPDAVAAFGCFGLRPGRATVRDGLLSCRAN